MGVSELFSLKVYLCTKIRQFSLDTPHSLFWYTLGIRAWLEAASRGKVFHNCLISPYSELVEKLEYGTCIEYTEILNFDWNFSLKSRKCHKASSLGDK